MSAHGLQISRFGMALLVGAGAVLLGLAGGGIRAAAQETPDPKSEVGGLHSKFVDVNGVQARYYEAGSGEPMVMIHGGFTAGSSTANVFSRNIPELSKHFHVFAVDRLASGMGGNPLKDDDYTYQGDVEFIYGFLQALNLGSVHLVGHSAGGAIALYLAIEHPEVAKTLTILAMGPENPSPAPDNKTRLDLSKCPDQSQYEGLQCRVAMLAWLPNTFDGEYWSADRYMATLPKSKEARAKLNAGAGRSFDFPAFKQKMLDKVRDEGSLQMPVLLVAGKNDVLDWGVNDETAKLRGEMGLFDIIAAKNTRVQMIVITNGGHFMYREHPDEFNAYLETFIDTWEKYPSPPAQGNFPKPPQSSGTPPRREYQPERAPGVIPGRQQIGQPGA
jgi:2-hydroxy-6-oxonona-2,4-dienedioate hydrolase